MEALLGKLRLRRSSALLAIFFLLSLPLSRVFADDASVASSSLDPASGTIATTTDGTLLGAGDSENIQGGTIAFQGNLNDASGTSVSDGFYNIDFKIYDAPTDGNVQWEESFTGDERIQVTGGKFSASLGESSPINLDFDNNTYYLAVTVGNTGDTPVWDKEMTPREEIITVQQLLAQAKADGKSALDELIQALYSGNNMVVIVDSATMANLLASMEQQATNQNSATPGGGGFLSQLAGFFANMFESIQSELIAIAHGITQSLNLLADISQKVDEIYQAVVVNNKVPLSASALSSMTPPGSTVPDQQSGTAVVLADDENINIATPAIETDSNVFITLASGSGQGTAPLGDWRISKRVRGQNFTVTFDKPVTADTVINWWVLNTDSPTGSATSSTGGAQNTTTPSADDTSSPVVPDGTTITTATSSPATSTMPDQDILPASSSTDVVSSSSDISAVPDASAAAQSSSTDNSDSADGSGESSSSASSSTSE
jgi:hypothetical protein